MVNPDVFDNLGPIWVHLDTFGPFQTKINLLPHKDKVGFIGGAFEQKIQILQSLHLKQIFFYISSLSLVCG